MANNKKIFTITINGVETSINAVTSLNKALDDAEKRIKNLQKAKIDITANVNNSSTKTVVAGNKGTTDTITKQKNSLSELQKLVNSVNKEQLKNEALLTDEYKQQLVIKQKIQQENKTIIDQIKQQAKGVTDENGAYADTLAGQRAYLSDLKNQLANTQLNTDEWTKLGEEVKRVNDYVKALEESYGVFTRNVGNYPSAAKGFKELENGAKEYYNTLNGLNAKLNDLNDTLGNLDLGSKEYKDTEDEIKKLNKQLSELKAGAEVAGNAMEEKLGVKFTTVINGVTYTFDDVNQGIGLLEDKLYSMAQAGNTSSKEFKNIQAEIVRLRNSVVSVDAAIDGMIGTSKGLRTITSMVNGFMGIASLGQGLQGLFGGNSQQLDEAIQKFTSLSLVLQGISAIQLEMNQNATSFGRFMNAANNSVNKLFESFKKFKAVDAVSAYSEYGEAWANTFKNERGLNSAVSSFSNIIKKSENVKKSIRGLSDEMQKQFAKNNKMAGLFYNYYSTVETTNEAINNYVKSVNELRASNSSVEKSFQAMQEASARFTTELPAAKNRIDLFTGSLSKFVANHTRFAMAINVITKALKAFGKATVVLIAIEAIMKAFENLGNLWQKVKNLFGDTGLTVDSVQTLTYEIQTQRTEFDKMADTLDTLNMSQAEYNATLLKMQGYLADAGNQMKLFVGSMDKAKELSDNLDAGNSFFSVGSYTPANIQEWAKEYDKLRKAVERGTDRGAAGGHGASWWNTQADAMEDFADAQKALVYDINAQIKKINFNDPEKAVKQFKKIFSGTLGDMRKEALNNVDQIFPEETWAKNLQQLVNNYSNMCDIIIDKNQELKDSINGTSDEAQRKIEEMNRKIRDINTYNMQFNPRQGRFASERQALKDQYDDEVKDAEGNQKLIDALTKKYHNDRMQLIKRQANEIKQVQLDTQQNNIDAMKDGLNKRLKQIELARQREINEAKNSDINVSSQIASINRKYDAQILDEKKNFYKRQVEAAKERNRELMELEQQLANSDIQAQRANRNRNTASAKTQLTTDNANATNSFGYNVDLTGNAALNARKEYYDRLLETQRDYLSQKNLLDKQEANDALTYSLGDENENYNNQLKQLDDFLSNQKQKLNEDMSQGLINRKQYNEQLKQLQESYNKEIEQLTKTHEQTKQSIINEYNAKQENTQKDFYEGLKQENGKYMNNMVSNLKQFYEDIENQTKENTRNNVGPFGIINYNEQKQNLTNALNDYKQVMKDIQKQEDDLNNKFRRGEISFGDFSQAKKDLADLKDETKKSISDIQNMLGNLLNATINSVMNVINTYMNALNEVWGLYNDMMSNQLDYEQEKLDAKQELLDAELEQLEDAYSKQEEITQKHSDKIDSIEDELSNARGDRRQALIDQLAKERDAELQSLQNQQEIQQQKEENQRKSEALEKQQEALQKKRWEQDKKNKIVQATINTFTAVSNALAVQPWFLGLALSATALALGMANVAKISAQKYFANGGLLKGNSHANGGIPVGNTGIEVEGNEYVVNKKTTMDNLPLLEYINSQKRPLTKSDLYDFYDNGKTSLVNKKMIGKYATGGQLPSGINNADIRRLMNYQPQQDDRPIVVSVVDIINKSENIREVQALSGLS